MFSSIFGFIVLILLLIFHTACVNGAKNGLLIWYKTLVPTLLPFMIITNALSETNAYQVIGRCLNSLFGKRTYDVLCILVGNLCGYPLGGKIIYDFIKKGYLSPAKGQNLLPYTSTISPMFLIGYVHNQIMASRIPLWIFLLSIYSPILIGFIFLNTHTKTDNTQPPRVQQKAIPTINDTFMQAVRTIVLVGVYVMIFSILLEILFSFFHGTGAKIIFSFLEITNGIHLLSKCNLSFCQNLPLMGALCSFGGLCSIFQIKCVNPLMNIKKYLLTKLILSAGTFFILTLYTSIAFLK